MKAVFPIKVGSEVVLSDADGHTVTSSLSSVKSQYLRSDGRETFEIVVCVEITPG